MKYKSVFRSLLYFLFLLGWVVAVILAFSAWHLFKTWPEEDLKQLRMENAALLEKNKKIELSLLHAEENVVRLHSDLGSLREARSTLSGELNDLQKYDPLKNARATVLLPQDGAPGIDGLPLIWDKTAKRGGLYVGQLPPPEEGKDYQLWIASKESEKLTSLGILIDSESNYPFELPRDTQIENVLAFAISIEPDGGSEQPKGPVVYLGALAD
ncbi:MAG: anti-sigma factor [Chthoniobacterales bacterium]